LLPACLSLSNKKEILLLPCAVNFTVRVDLVVVVAAASLHHFRISSLY